MKFADFFKKITIKKLIYFSAAVFAAMLLFLLFIIFDLPKFDGMSDYRPYQVSKVYDTKKNLIAEFYIEKRRTVSIDSIPEHVKLAFIAAEDKDFYKHSGIDYKGLLRAILTEVKYRFIGGKRIGGSTITQQTAKTFLLSPKKTYTRKIKEIILSYKIEKAFSKDEILNLYLNQIYFGHGVYGIQEAAQLYFNVDASDLTLSQAATLAAIPKSPSRINPHSNIDRTLKRRAYVLNAMKNNEFIDDEQKLAAEQENIVIKPKKNPYKNKAPYYVNAAKQQIEKLTSKESLYRDGLDITLALNIEYQLKAQKSLKKGLQQLDKRQGFRGVKLRLEDSNITKLRQNLLELKNELRLNNRKNYIWDLSKINKNNFQNLSQLIKLVKIRTKKNKITTVAFVSDVNAEKNTATIDMGSYFAEIAFKNIAWKHDFRLSYSQEKYSNISDILTIGDLVRVKIYDKIKLYQKPIANGSVIAIDPHTHRVLALSGGYNFNDSKFNRAIQAKRQAGSVFKPFVYALAIDKELITPASLITDAPKVFYDPWKGNNWRPQNHTKRYLGDITVRTCLQKSVNICSIKILDMLGVNNFYNFAKQLDLTLGNSHFAKNLTLALGSADIIPLKLVNAFSIFANLGSFAEPILIEKIAKPSGEVIHESPKFIMGKQVIKPQSAFVMTQLLKNVVKNGTSRKALVLKRPLGGKTGTSNDMRNSWFIGYSPELVTGVYLGFDDYRPLGFNEYAVKNALPIWIDFMQYALRSTPVRDFDEPSGITWKEIDQKTGKPIDPYQAHTNKNAVKEAFIDGTEPYDTIIDNNQLNQSLPDYIDDL